MKTKQRHFEATIVEKGGHVLHPSYVGNVDEEYLIEFWGLNEPDVVVYVLKEIIEDEIDRCV